MDNKIICDACKTENEPEYIYCKNCGNTLRPEKKKTADYTANPNFTHEKKDYSGANPNFTHENRNYSGENPNFSHRNTYRGANPNFTYGAYRNNMNGFFDVMPDIDGVSGEEMISFVGKGADKIVPKFAKMQISGSKVSWCWPAAILGVLGPVGAAIWFFYRKMYKAALIIAAVGLILTCTVAAIGGKESANTPTKQQYESALEQGNYKEFFDLMNSAQTTREKIAGYIDNLIEIATIILSGLFSLYIYKDFCVMKINETRASVPDEKYYKFSLSICGGTNGGMAVVGVLIILAQNILISVFSALF